MKKLIAFVLAVVCVFGSAGCGHRSQEQQIRESSPQMTLPAVIPWDTSSQETEPRETEPRETEPQETEPQEIVPLETLPPEGEYHAQLPEDRSQPVELTDMAVQYITNLLDCIQWREDTAHCEDEYLIYIDGRQLLYHDVCGTLRDPQSKQMAWIAPDVRDYLNVLLGHDRSSPLPTGKAFHVEADNESLCICSDVASSYEAGQTVTVALSCPTEHVLNAYVNGMLMPTSSDGWMEYLIFTMPCEDIRIEIKLIGVYR